jgi:hypothetical protein
LVESRLGLELASFELEVEELDNSTFNSRKKTTKINFKETNDGGIRNIIDDLLD